MRLPSALLVALLLVSAAAAPAVGAVGTGDAAEAGGGTHSVSDATVSPRITTIDNTTNHLTIPPADIERSGFNHTGVDVGTAVAAGSRQLHERHAAAAFENRFRRAGSEFQRRQLVRGLVADVEARQDLLEERQQTAIRRYATGETSAGALVRTRVLVDAEARALLATLDRVAGAQQLEPDYSMTSGTQTNLRNVEGSLQTLRGATGESLGDTVGGEAPARTVFVEAATDGYMLAAIEDGTYVREARLGSERRPTDPDQFAASATDDTNRLDAADDRASELYTWLYERQRPSFTYYGTSGIYELTANHPTGQLTSYLDGATTNVFYEYQQRGLATVRTTAAESAVADGLRLEVQRAYATGPVFVSVTSNETGVPVDGAVRIDGHNVGASGNDGVRWAVEPRGAYTVTVTTDDGREVRLDVPAR